MPPQTNILPTRQPDFYFSLGNSWYADGWQEDDHWVIKLELKEGLEMIHSEPGLWLNVAEQRQAEAKHFLFHGLIGKYVHPNHRHSKNNSIK